MWKLCMWKLCEGTMRRNLFVLSVGPLVMLFVILFTSPAMARDKANYNAATTIHAASYFASQATNNAVVNNVQLSVQAQQVTSTATITSPLPDLVPPTLGPTTTIGTETTVTAEVAVTPTLTTVQLLTVTQTPEPEAIEPVDPDTQAANAQAEEDAAYALPIEGTIIANRTEADIRFFVEGATYELGTARSIGLNLPRVTAVLNLYNCDANTPETTEGCFWDPYLLDRDGFYEIVSGSNAGANLNLTLQPAGSPPVNQIWLQNRTGNRESVFYENEEIEIPPAAVYEFSSAADVPAIIYLRSCLVLPDRTVCEWVPTDARPGFYYALDETSIAGSLPNSEIVALELRPILSEDGDPIELPAQVNCQLQVPTLNVRSGPGLEYQIVAKIRGTEQEPGRVTAVGRDELGEWLAVDARIADGGWIVASPSFIQCTGDINSLAIAEITDGRLAPTPEPVVAAPPVTSAGEEEATEATGDDNSEDVATPEPDAPAPFSLAEGQALIVINNGFDQEMRFTLDQRFRIEQGRSEYDLQPGESISLLVFPGQIAFSVSSPWRGLSDNSEFFIDNKETRTLWLVFVPDPDGSGRWILQY